MRNLFGDIAEQPQRGKDEGKERPEDPNKERAVACRRTRGRYVERRIKSELALEEVLPWHFEQGTAYHCFSFGDVDALTYLRVIIKQQRVEYVLLSTWCMAATDVEEIGKWIRR